MKIVADENLPLLSEFFEDLGDIYTHCGRDIKAKDVADADILLIRSVTQVNESLLKGSKVRFVGTATIGQDHVDLDYLKNNNIRFARAPGCNAHSVGDYVLSVLSILADTRGMDITSLSVGLVGVGSVGFALRQRLEAMGITTLACDPFKNPKDVGNLHPLDEVLKADVVSLHTPLTNTGEHPTHHLINASCLSNMQEDACLINSSRGAVVDNQALLCHLKQNPHFNAVLDVWEGEPSPNVELLQQCFIATPHIAGYSLDGKMRGSEMVYQQLCEYLGLPIRLKLAQFLPEPGIKRINFTDQIPMKQALRTAIRAAYEVRVDDGMMRAHFARAGGSNTSFDSLRRDYPLRRDISQMRVGVPSRCHELESMLCAAGFVIKNK